MNIRRRAPATPHADPNGVRGPAARQASNELKYLDLPN
jgi:hypothetical protein